MWSFHGILPKDRAYYRPRGEAAIRRRLGVLASRMVVRGARFENGVRLAQLGRAVDASVADAAMAAFNSPGDFPAIIAETEATLAKFKDKLPPDILVAKVAAARETIAQNTVAGLIELDPALAIQGLKEGVFDDDLPAADRKRLRARAKAAVRDRRAQAERGQARDRAAARADGARRLVVLEGAIGRGEAGEQAIAEAADILDDPTRVRLHEKLDAKRAEDAARDRRVEKVSAVLAGGVPATGDGGGDSGDKDLRPGASLREAGASLRRRQAPEWRQAVDDHYASLADALETMDPDTRARFEDDYARATGVLPEPVAKRLRAGLLSADPAEQAAAATRLARLQDVDPALIEAIPANERRRAGAIAEFADLGLTPARAVELAEEKPAGGNDQSAGEDDELAMGAAREAAKAAAAAALREASKMGGVIRDKLRQLLGKKKVDRPPEGGVIAVETVANIVRNRIQQRNEERARAGKEPTARKLDLVPKDFGPGATVPDVIEAIARAQLSGAIQTTRPALRLNLEDVDKAFATRVKKDTARFGRTVDVSGLRHAIDTQSMRHAFKMHGPGNETDPENEPISPEVMSIYLDVVKNYDRIRGVRARGGAQRITFEKRIDGVVVVSEQARTTEGTLSFFNMWIEKMEGAR